MRFSKEKENEIKSMVRLLLVRQPNLSMLQVQDALAKQGLVFDRNYIGRVVKKIHDERSHRIDNQSLAREIAKFEDLYEALAHELWIMILDKTLKASERNGAIRTLIDAHKSIFDKKFDAGIFEKQLGKLKVEETLSPEDEAIIKKAIDYATGRAKQFRDRETS